MVAAADDLKSRAGRLTAPGVEANLTGAAGMWSDFNEANREAMLKSELFSWPVTLAILVLAFGSLVAAGLPLMLTIVGLVASAGVLYLGTLLSPISIWAMNFALMFALALGIDYALFVVMRFRGALFGQGLEPAEAVGDDDGHRRQGGPLLRPHRDRLAGGGDARPQPRLPLGLARDHDLRPLRPRRDLTLLPAVLAKLGPRIDKLALPWAHSGEHRSPRFARWGELLWRRPLLFGGLGAARSPRPRAAGPRRSAPACPRSRSCRTGDHSRVGYEQIGAAFGPGAPGPLQVNAPPGGGAGGSPPSCRPIRGSRSDAAAAGGPRRDGADRSDAGRGPSTTAFGATLDRLRAGCPPQRRSAARRPKTTTSRRRWRRRRRWRSASSSSSASCSCWSPSRRR